MWNQVACNKVLMKKSLQKEKARLLQSLRNTKSTLRSTNHRPTFKSSSSKKTYEQRNWQIYKQNKTLTTRIQSICKSRMTKSMQKIKASTSLLKMIDNNKRKITDIKNKQIQNANKKMLEKIVSVNSSLASIRLKTIFNQNKIKPKTLITLQNINPQTPLKDTLKHNKKNINSLENSNVRRTKTQITQPTKIINIEQDKKKENIKCNTQQHIEQQYQMEEAIQQICDNN